jgi:integrase
MTRTRRTLERLKALTVKRTNKAGMYADGGGLYLQVTNADAKSWIFRYAVDGRERFMGLGSVNTIGLAEAREAARECRKLRHSGIDPIERRDMTRQKNRAEAAKAITFNECVDAYLTAHEQSWRNVKHRGQWRNTLKTYARPVLGELAVSSIDTGLVLKVLEPIWSEKPETANRLRGRIESILNWATVREYRSGENPARWKGHLQKLLPSKAKVRPVNHHPALPYSEIPTFMAELRGRDGRSARALEITVLTALRTGEVIGAKWSEFDFGAKIWTVPAERMKSGKEHRVPLSDRAVEIFSALPREAGNSYVFIGDRAGKPLSNMAMLELLRDMRRGYVTHGFRSTFRDWAAEMTGYPNHVVEMALAHVIGNKVEAAYRRGDLFERRRRLMAEWERYCTMGKPSAAMVPLRAG